MKRVICLLLALLTLSACQSVPSQDTPAAPESGEAVPDTAEETLKLPDPYEIKRQLLILSDVNAKAVLFESSSLEQFLSVKDEVLGQIRDDSTSEELIELYNRLAEARDRLEIQRGDIPRVFIESSGAIRKNDSACYVTIVGGTGDTFEPIVSKSCLIKVRGRSTAVGPKYPYRIKFDNKTEVLGISSGKKWVLLSNLFDKTMMRNYLALDLAGKMNLTYSPECMYVDLYINGAYAGNYLLTEGISDAKNSTDLETKRGDCLFEFDASRDDGSLYIKTPMGIRLKYQEPESPSADEQTWALSFFREMEAAIKTHDMSKYEVFIDVDSFVDFYLHSEIVKNIDVNDFSTRVFIKNGILYYGPVWDCDLSMGNIDKDHEEKYREYANAFGHGTASNDTADGEWMNTGWFAELLRDPAFRQKVVERFDELYPVFENMFRENELGPSVIDSVLEKVGPSFEANYAKTRYDEMKRYTDLSKNETLPFEEEVEWLRNWLERRLAFVTGLIDSYRS